MNTDTTKRYRLMGVEKTIPEWCKMFPYLWGKDFADKKYQFEEVLPVSEPVKERIEIGSLNLHDNFLGNKVDTYWYQFCSNKVLDGTKFYEISNLLERYLNGEMNNPAPSALNDTVVEDKCLFDGERINKYLMDEFGQTGKTEPLRFQKRYSQKEVDTIRKEAFEAGRHRFQITSCGTLGAVEFRYPNYSDYLSSLNLNTNDISKDQNDKGNYTPPLSEIKEDNQTVTNNDDVACLSLNDVINCSQWYSGHRDNEWMKFSLIDLKEKVNQKLKQC